MKRLDHSLHSKHRSDWIVLCIFNIEIFLYLYLLLKLRFGNYDLQLISRRGEERGRERGRGRASGSSYYEEMRPILLALRLAGRFPFETADTGAVVSRGWALASLALHASLTLLVLDNAALVAAALRAAPSRYDTLVQFFFSLVSTLLHFSAPLVVLRQTPLLVAFINRWSDFQVEYERWLRRPLSAGLSRVVRVEVCVVGAFSLVLACLEVAVTPIAWYQFLPNLVVYLSSYLHLSLWYFTCLKIRRTSEEVRREALGVLGGGGSGGGRSARLGAARRLWSALASLLHDLGPALAADALPSLLASLLVTVFLGYDLVRSALAANLSLRHLSFAAVILGAGFYVYVASDAAYKTTLKVGREFSSSLFAKNTTSLDLATVAELRVWLREMEAKAPTVTLLDLIVVDRGLIVGYLLTIVNYQVYLQQLKSG